MSKDVLILLNEAAGLLYDNGYDGDVLTEAAADDKVKKIVSDMRESAKNKDTNKFKKAMAEFKVWWNMPNPDGNKQKLRSFLWVIYELLMITINAVSGGLLGYSLGSMLSGDVKIKYCITTLLSLSTIFIVFKKLYKDLDTLDEVQKEYLDEYIKKFNKKVSELKEILNKIDDKKSKEYKVAYKSYTDAVKWLEWFKVRKSQIKITDKVNKAKSDLKDAKNSKDKQRIAEAKANLKTTRELANIKLQ